MTPRSPTGDRAGHGSAGLDDAQQHPQDTAGVVFVDTLAPDLTTAMIRLVLDRGADPDGLTGPPRRRWGTWTPRVATIRA